MNDTGPTVAELFGGGVKPRDTRERLLFTALDLFASHGFHAVGLDRILGEVGVTKTTFYNHFASKDDLVLEAIRLRDAWESQAFRRALQEKGGYEPRALLLAVFDVLDEWFSLPEYRGCLFLLACAEFPSPNDPVHCAAASHFGLAAEELTKIARAAGVDDPPALAREWILLMQGATTNRMVGGGDDAAGVARRIAEQLLARRLEGGLPARGGAGS